MGIDTPAVETARDAAEVAAATASTNRSIQHYLIISVLFVFSAIGMAIGFQLFVVSTNWLLLIDGMLLAYLLALIWIWRRVDTTAVERTLIRLCVAQWTLAGALTLFEGWFIHLTPLIIILPLMMSTGIVEVGRYWTLVRWAVGLVIVITITARLFPQAPLHKATTGLQRTYVALTFTPAYVMFVSWVAWRNHTILSASNERLVRAGERLRMAEASVEAELRAKVARAGAVASRAARTVDRWLGDDASTSQFVTRVEPVEQDLDSALRELRHISHGMGPGLGDTTGGASADAGPATGDRGTGRAPIELAVDVPLDGAGETAGHEPNLKVAIHGSTAISLACLGASLLVYLFVLRDPLMLGLLVFLAVAQTLPTLAARSIVDRSAAKAIYLFAFAMWVPPTVFGYSFSLVKAFFVPAMLIPVVLALPYLAKRNVRALSITAGAAIAVMIAVARISTGAEITNDSPDIVNDAIVIVLLPLGTFIVLWLAHRNHLALTSRSAQLKRSQARIEVAYAAVRERIERDLHDGAQQRFVSARLQLKVAQAASDHPAKAAENLALARDELDSAAESLRTLVLGPNEAMSPSQLDGELQVIADRAPNPVSVSTLDLPNPVPAPAVSAVWFCCNEAIGNTLKHMGPETTSEITLIGAPEGGLTLTVTDNGAGFDPAIATGGAGLSNMVDRFTSLDGTLSITGTPGDGTTLVGYIPPHVIDLRNPLAEPRWL